jgi:uncharacterized protein YyaL (SSP411 family)
MDIVDNVIPSSNAIMAEVMYYLGIYFENNDYLEKSRLMVSKTAGKNRIGNVLLSAMVLAGRFIFP